MEVLHNQAKLRNTEDLLKGHKNKKINLEVKDKCETETIKIEKLNQTRAGLAILTSSLEVTVLYSVRASSKFHWWQ